MLRAALLLALLSGVAGATSYTASVSGNWNNSATWGGAGIPGAGDVPTILSGIHVTLPQGFSVTPGSITFISGTSNNNQTALFLAFGSTLTLGGNLAMGTASSGYAGIYQSSNSWLNMGSYNIIQDAGGFSFNYFDSTGTAAFPFYVTSAGGQFTENGGGFNFQDTLWTYGVFVGSMVMDTNAYLTAGANFAVSSCTFSGLPKFVMPQIRANNPNSYRYAEYNDFRNFVSATNGNIAIEAAGIDHPTGKNDFNYNTVSTDTAGGLLNGLGLQVNASSVTIHGNTFKNFFIVAATNNGVDTFVSSNTFAATQFVNGGGCVPGISNLAGNSYVGGNFEYAECSNPHFMQLVGTHTIVGNIAESNTQGATLNQDGKMYLGGTGTVFSSGTFSNNLGIGMIESADMLDFLGGTGVTDHTVFMHNTIWYSSHNPSNVLTGWTVGETYSGRASMLDNASDNLIVFDTFTALGSIEQDLNIAAAPAKISTMNCNGYWNTGATPGNGTFASLYQTTAPANGYGTNDVNANPNFKASRSDLATWDASLGGPGTGADAIAQLLLQNGYGGTYNPAYNQAALMAYLQNAYTPTNSALHGVTGVGCDGSDIGAFPVGTAAGALNFLMFGRQNVHGLGNFILK